MHFQQKEEQYEILLLVAQKKTSVEIYIPFLWWVLHGSMEPIVLQIPEAAKCKYQSAYVHIPISRKVSSEHEKNINCDLAF